ncbi:MAG: hypothetical protein ACT4QG_11155 [Sporichthyaceae bacterium]
MASLRFNPAPGWPTPPAGWEMPTSWRPDPSWPAAPEGWLFWVDTAANPWVGAQGRRRRSNTARGWMVAGAFAALFAAMFVFGVLVAIVGYIAMPEVMDDPAKTDQVDSILTLTMLVPMAGVAALYAFLCRKVSYRSRDAFLLFVPFYGWYFFGLIVWRLTGLPHRDWSPRWDEIAVAQEPQTPAGPYGPMAPFYV